MSYLKIKSYMGGEFQIIIFFYQRLFLTAHRKCDNLKFNAWIL